MRNATVRFPDEVQGFLRDTIATAGGNEVFFLARLAWAEDSSALHATVEEVEVFARGNRTSVPAIIHAAEGWDVAIHNHPTGHLEPSDADYAVAHELAKMSVGFSIISNDAQRHYLVVSPFRERASEEDVDPEEVREVFSRDGPLSSALDGFESREGQVDMALEVTRAFNENRVLAAEAGTGVGKSFAYLVPAILWSVKNRKRVVVSTRTINLQEQLHSKDLPFLAKVLPVQFGFALIKGRNNYACRRKVGEVAADLRQQETVEDQQREQLRSLVEWVNATSDGSRTDLAWVPSPEVWEKVMSETDKSLKVNCQHYSECFYYEAKRQASKAHVLIANHHLFFADLAVRRQTGNYDANLVLPAYKRVIFDEAHHLEDVASEFFGTRFSRTGLRTRLGRLVAATDSRRGVIPTLVRRLRVYKDEVAASAIERTFVDSVNEVRERIEDLFREIEDGLRAAEARLPAPASRYGRRAAPLASPAVEGSGLPVAGERPEPARFERRLRYTEEDENEPFWDIVSAKLEAVQAELARLVKVNDRALQSLATSRLTAEQIESQKLELESFGSRLQGLLGSIDHFRGFNDATQVRWISSREGRAGRDASLDFASSPIRVAGDLKTAVFDPMSTVVLTSATLSVGESVEFLGDRLGLSQLGSERFDFRQLASPFDFRRQVLTLVPTDFPLPESPDYARQIPEAVFRLLCATRGRAFVLFTSYHLLRKTYSSIEGRLTALGLRPMAQGEAERSKLLERFRDGTGNILFATDSFWEGVDVKGKALESVIITRLPFRVPTEPIQEARMEELEGRGLNPFSSFTVPQAVLKFKQGFGRLIRSRSDRGIVAILDRRIVTKGYGRVFLSSLPDTTLVKAPLDDVVGKVEEFFATQDVVGETIDSQLPGPP